MEDTLIVSGSGDTTVRVWGQAAREIGVGEWACRAVLEGHRCADTSIRYLCTIAS